MCAICRFDWAYAAGSALWRRTPKTEAMAAELVDRFGVLPKEVENLLGVVAA